MAGKPFMVVFMGILRILDVNSQLFFSGSSSVVLQRTTNLAASGFSLQFRTCSNGTILQQGNNFQVSLEQTSFLNHSYLNILINGTNFLLSPQFSMDSNLLITLFLDTGGNQPVLGVSGLYNKNISLPSTLESLIVSSRPVLGLNFTGCLYSGRNIDLTRTEISNGVQEGCPLEDRKPCLNRVCPNGFTGRNCETNIDDCASVPCHSFSTCVDLVNGFRCLCGPRWTGKTCDTFLGSLCTNSTCQNDAICQESSDRNNFTCVCRQGFTGRFCESAVTACLPNPCLNDGLCSNVTQDAQEFKCTCKEGFAGIRCEQNIDDCAQRPCQNGICIDGVKNFTCNCSSSGFAGRTCEVDVDECQTSRPCENNATCRNFYGGYSCQCQTGFTGINCETDIKECQATTNPCKNNGTCEERNGGFVCRCAVGYNGPTCEVNIDDCKPGICGNGSCVDGVNNYSCICNAGFTGQNCQVNIDDCKLSPCLNGGQCIDGINNYSCDCSPAYTGRNCENFTNPCKSNPCQNNGTCLNNTKTGFECNCTNTSYGGNLCQFKLGNCFPNNPCRNGNCSDIGSTYNCSCFPGFEGINCTQDINECATNPCQNDGVCVNTPGSFRCNCTDFTEGTYCEKDIDECKRTAPCKNGGRCYNILFKGYDCGCSGTGFTGPTCETRQFPCKNEEGRLGRNFCNNGTCINEIDTYKCNCSAGYTGEFCDVNIDECSFRPCRNNAVCTDLVNNYLCTCQPGFTGKNCEVDINECEPNPCKNLGKCIEKSNLTALMEAGKNANLSFSERAGYVCQCLAGTNGTNCETNVDDCALSPCRNNGTCIDLINDYNCTCSSGFTGKNCSISVNGCTSMPCKNNGTCQTQAEGFSCACAADYTGRTCETVITACITRSPCQNGAQCIAEGSGYRCVCPESFTGTDCEFSTNVNFNGSGFWQTNLKWKAIALRFRTTLPAGVVLHFQEDSNSGLVYLDEGRLWFLALPSGSPQMLSGELMNNGSPRSLYVQFMENLTSFSAERTNVTVSSPNFINASGSIGGSFMQTHLTGVRLTNFTGCISDVSIDGRVLAPLQVGVLQSASAGSCFKTVFCSSAFCNRQGRCIDDWVNLRCSCFRRFFGEKCSQDREISDWKGFFCCSSTWLGLTLVGCPLKEIQAFSFAAVNAVSPPSNQTNGNRRRKRRAVTLDSITNATTPRFILYEDATNFTDNSSINFFVRTRTQTGVLTMVSTSNSNSNSMPLSTYLSLQLANGILLFNYRHATQEISKNASTSVADGQWHEVEITRQDVKIDNRSAVPFDIRTPFPVRFFYFGGVDNLTYFRDVLFSIDQFEGCIQDIIFQGKTVTNQAIPGRTTAEVNATQASQGCNGSDVCGSNPCLYGGRCNDLWNAYNCTCTSGFAGATCNLFGCPVLDKCENGTQCLDIAGMPGQTTCVSSVTFNGVNHSASISSALFNASSLTANISFELRTRRSDSSIVVSSNSSAAFFGIGLVGGRINVTYRFGTQAKFLTYSGLRVDDGQWHNVQLFSSSSNTSLKIDLLVVATENVVVLGADWRYLISTQGMEVGSSALRISNGIYSASYKGCLNNFYVGTAFVSLNASGSLAPRSGCHSDNLCNPTPCIRGTCAESFDAFSCSCPAHSTGKQCEVTSNVTCAIEPSPCLNGGQCVNLTQPSPVPAGSRFSTSGFDFFNCSCPEGFFGYLCQNVTDECSPNPCQNGLCIDGHLNYSCDCNPGFTGRNCTNDTNDCLPNPCANNGICIDGVLNYTCICPSTYQGRNCTEDVNECLTNNPCVNNATCTNFDGGYNCTCLPSFGGNNCQFNASQSCLSNPCLNGATCYANSSGYHCNCSAGFAGIRCEQDIDECASNPCQNNATCIDSRTTANSSQFAGYRCSCSPQHTGINCEVEINPCNSSPCKNNATCQRITFQDYSCNCTAEFRGSNCDVKRTACDSSPCFNNGTCTPAGSGFNCTCVVGYDGQRCEIDTNPCMSTPCQNLATCTPILQDCGQNTSCKQIYDRYNCTCTTRWLGVLCTVMNPCSPNPCQNGGTCIVNFNGTVAAGNTCSCPSGYQGSSCQDEQQNNLGLYIGIGVGGGVLVLLIILIVCLLKDKGGMHGTYSPKKEERQGQVEMRPVEKPKPRQERLI